MLGGNQGSLLKGDVSVMVWDLDRNGVALITDYAPYDPKFVENISMQYAEIYKSGKNDNFQMKKM